VKKGDALALSSDSGRFIYQSYSCGTAPLQSCIEIRHREAKVMDSHTPFREESADGGILRLRFQQLHQSIPRSKGVDPRAIHIIHLHWIEAEHITVEPRLLRHLADCNANVCQARTDYAVSAFNRPRVIP